MLSRQRTNLAILGGTINTSAAMFRPFFSFSGEGATVFGRPEAGFIRHPHQPSWTELNLHSDKMPPKFDPNEIKIGMFCGSEGNKRSRFTAETGPLCVGLLRGSWPAGRAYKTVKIGHENLSGRTGRMIVFLLLEKGKIKLESGRLNMGREAVCGRCTCERSSSC